MSSADTAQNFKVVDLALAFLGEAPLGLLSVQGALLRHTSLHASSKSVQAAAYRLRLLRVQALAAYHFLPEQDTQELPKQYLEDYAGAPQAGEVWHRLEMLQAQVAARNELLQHYEYAAGRNDFSAALELIPQLTELGIDLAAEGYLLPVLIGTPVPSASLQFAGQVVANADELGTIGWWADPYGRGNLTFSNAGLAIGHLASRLRSLSMGFAKAILPELIFHVHADVAEPVQGAWQVGPGRVGSPAEVASASIAIDRQQSFCHPSARQFVGGAA